MFFADVSITFESQKESFYHFLCCEDAFRKSFCGRAFIGISLRDSLYWWQLIDDVQQPIQGISDIAKKKNNKFSCNKRLFFLYFYKIKDYFLDMIITTKDLCARYVCSWETPEAFRRTSLGDCSWNIQLLLLLLLPITFLLVHHFSRSSPPKKLQK